MLYAAGQFVILTILAMLLYPGGAKFDLHSRHYQFFRNFFSDLGATKTYSGHSNTTSHILFIIALASVGLAIIAFSGTWRLITTAENRAGWLGWPARILAILSGVGFLGIALTPWDLVLDAHNLFVRLAFGLLLGYVLCLSAIQVLNHWPRLYTSLDVIYLLALCGYIFVLFAGPTLQSSSGLEFQVAAQKIIVYLSIANLGAQALAVRQRTMSC